MARGIPVVSLGVAALLGVLSINSLAEADPPNSNSAKTTADNAAAPPVGVAAGQISQIGARKRVVDSGQIAPSRRDSRATSAAQLATSAHPAASAQIAPSARRDTQVSAVVGQDRCDPTAPTAQQPECAQILDKRGDDFAGRGIDNTPSTVDSNTSDDLVDGIISSGTGSVVRLPPK